MGSFLNPAEYQIVRGLRRFAEGLRRVAGRVFLGPVYAEVQRLRTRQEELELQLAAVRGRAFDQAALARRLAAIEDLLIELRASLPTDSGEWRVASDEKEDPSSVATRYDTEE
jgi:hypothetical protein